MDNHFEKVIDTIRDEFTHSARKVVNKTWQSIAAPQATYELLNYSVRMVLPTEDLDYYRENILPNLPWADDHFLKERVSGDPINPGTEWRNWPYAASADKHRQPGAEDPEFSHSYAERYWPKFAGLGNGGVLMSDHPSNIRRGIRFPYGDLDDLVDVLVTDPTTRQAYLPVWFPEDLGAATIGQRVPCTLGYHFIVRDNAMHVVYYIRSCDYVRHFRDDVYMTIRLLLWVLEQCRLADPNGQWDEVSPGTFTMHITSLHIFESDRKFVIRSAPGGASAV